MFEEVKKAIGTNWFRAFVVVLGCLWVWHSFFSGVAEVGTSQNVIAQGENAAPREKAIRERAEADAEIQRAIAQQALRRQKAEADQAEALALKAKAEACSARMTAFVDNTPINRLRQGDEQLDKDCDPTYPAKACDEKWRAVLAHVDHDMNTAERQNWWLNQRNNFGQECEINEARAKIFREYIEGSETELERLNRIMNEMIKRNESKP